MIEPMVPLTVLGLLMLLAVLAVRFGSDSRVVSDERGDGWWPGARSGAVPAPAMRRAGAATPRRIRRVAGLAPRPAERTAREQRSSDAA